MLCVDSGIHDQPDRCHRGFEVFRWFLRTFRPRYHLHGHVHVYDNRTVTETRYLIPAGADWAVWDDSNAVLAFMTDTQVIQNARENERELGAEFAGAPLPPDPTPEEAWAYVNELWSGDPGGRRSWRPTTPNRHTPAC